MSSLLIFAEHRNGKIKKASFEAITKGGSLAKELNLSASVVLLGSGLSSLTSDAASYGVTSVITVDDAKLSNYSNSAYAKAIIEIAKSKDAKVVVFSATAMGKELAPYISAKLGASYAADAIDVSVTGSSINVVRPIYSGKANAAINLTKDIKVISLRPNVFPAQSVSASASVENVSVSFADTDFKTKVVDIVTGSGKLDVAEADIVVSGGRGLRAAENFNLIEDLAAVLGGAVGASRAAVDAGWRSHADQVGQTGKVVSPKLYIAVGISGAIQHIAGMNSSKIIVAINKDKDAPIFQIADYGIVGDLFEVVPAMTAELKKRLH